MHQRIQKMLFNLKLTIIQGFSQIVLYQGMQDFCLRFEGSPQKFGGAAYCDILYTQSKLYENILYKNLVHSREVWSYKCEAMTLEALKEHLQMQKNAVIYNLQEQISFLRQKNGQLVNKNLQRTINIVATHNQLMQALIQEKGREVLFIQGEKQLLQNRIQLLEGQLAKNLDILGGIQRERQEGFRKENQMQQLVETLKLKLKQKAQTYQLIQNENKTKVSQLNQDKLQLQLYFQKLMAEHTEDRKQQLQDLERFYIKKLQDNIEEKLKQSLSSKQNLEKILQTHHRHLEQSELNNLQLQQIVQTLRKQVQFERQKNASLALDIGKQEQVLDRYQGYLKQADQNIKQLKQLLLQSQQQLQRVKISLEKNVFDRNSFDNRIKICQQEARMWRQSYYLNKSRNFAEN